MSIGTLVGVSGLTAKGLTVGFFRTLALRRLHGILAQEIF
jgi:hypothetical protein